MKYVINRLIQLIPVLLGITFLSFAMMRLAGSDAITEMYADKGAVSAEIINAKRAQLGLDKPFLEQYFVWLKGLVTGDMGTSYVSGRDVFDTFISKLPATILLTVLSVILTIIISIPLGIIAAVRHDKVTDYILRFCSFIGNSMPNFFIDAVACYKAWGFASHYNRHRAPKCYNANSYFGYCHVFKIYATG